MSFAKWLWNFRAPRRPRISIAPGPKVIKRRSFATYLDADITANIFLTPEEQNAFCRMDKKNIFPIPNRWGEKGATTFALERVDPALVREALLSAYS
ncbi:MAG: hypothetical protein ABI646_05930 [Acidobacteriota bacterium]